MKGLRIVGVLLALIILIGISACGQQTNTTTQSAPSTTDGTQVSGTAIVGSEAMILEKLQNHHGIDRVLTAKHTREEWNVTLDRMISYGAKISEDEKKAIIDYLLSR